MKVRVCVSIWGFLLLKIWLYSVWYNLLFIPIFFNVIYCFLPVRILEYTVFFSFKRFVRCLFYTYSLRVFLLISYRLLILFFVLEVIHSFCLCLKFTSGKDINKLNVAKIHHWKLRLVTYITITLTFTCTRDVTHYIYF